VLGHTQQASSAICVGDMNAVIFYRRCPKQRLAENAHSYAGCCSRRDAWIVLRPNSFGLEFWVTGTKLSLSWMSSASSRKKRSWQTPGISCQRKVRRILSSRAVLAVSTRGKARPCVRLMMQAEPDQPAAENTQSWPPRNRPRQRSRITLNRDSIQQPGKKSRHFGQVFLEIKSCREAPLTNAVLHLYWLALEFPVPSLT